ncbi:MAG: glycosyltransferase family 39 protein [Thermoflexales bacterium]|nr:glycosyltransferase family 39 protein [Thermoflexales bacterium]
MTHSEWRTVRFGFALGLVVLLAGALRLHRLEWISLQFDQAYPLQYAMDIVRGYLWGAQPHGSVGAHPAVYLYVMAIPYLFTRNFEAVVAYRVLLDVLAVGMCGWVGARYFNTQVGLIAALLYAVAPWAIQFARNLWPVPQPLFSLVLLVGLLEVAVRKNPRGWALAGLGLALVAGTHLGGAYVLPAALVALWVGRKSFDPRWAALGAVPIALVVVGFVLHDAARGFESLRAYTAASSAGTRFSLAAAEFAAWLSGGLGLSSLTGQAFGDWMRDLPAWAPGVDALQVAWFALSCAWVLGVVLRGRGAPFEQALLMLWLASPVALQTLSSRPVMLQYLPVLLPAPFLVMAIALDDGLARIRRLGHVAHRLGTALALALVGGTAFGHITVTLRFADFVRTHATTNGYGQPAHAVLAARNAALDTLRSNTLEAELIAVIPDFPTPWNEQAAILRAVLADVPYRFMSASGDGFVFRPEGAHYLFAPGAEGMLARVVSFFGERRVHVARFETQPGRDTYYAYLRVTEPPELSQYATSPPARWDNGVQLERYRIMLEDVQHVRVESLLRVLQTPPEGADYHWFVHIVEGENKIAQFDGQGVHPFAWRAGDWIYQSHRVTLPAPAQPSLHVRLGNYTWPEVANVTVRVPNQPPDGAVRLPLPPLE